MGGAGEGMRSWSKRSLKNWRGFKGKRRRRRRKGRRSSGLVLPPCLGTYCVALAVGGGPRAIVKRGVHPAPLVGGLRSACRRGAEEQGARRRQAEGRDRK